MRKHHWCGAELWDHTFLLQEEVKRTDDGELVNTGKVRPLTLHPGSGVHPAGTSQVCSACFRNPYEKIKEHFRDADKNITVDDFGVVTLKDGSRLTLQQTFNRGASSQERRKQAKTARRRKQHLPLAQPQSGGTKNASELNQSVRRQLRRPQQSTRSKDTTQSLYHCVFEECGKVMHADENAAINIVRKWVIDKGISQAESVS